MQGFTFPASVVHAARNIAEEPTLAVQRVKEAEQRLAAYQGLVAAPMTMHLSSLHTAGAQPQTQAQAQAQ